MPADELKIRAALAEDGEALGELLIRSFNETYARRMPEVVMTERRRNELRQVIALRDRACILVAELGGRIVGTVTLFPPGHGYAELRWLALNPECQGQGLAAPLMDACERRAREWGAPGICLHVRRGAHGVARFYERRGYQRTPEGDRDLMPEVFLEAYRLDLVN